MISGRREGIVARRHALDEVAELLEVHRVQFHPELDPRIDPSPATCARCVELVERLIVLGGEIASMARRRV